MRHLHRGDAVGARREVAAAAGLAGIVALAIVLRVAHILALRSTPWFAHLVVDPELYKPEIFYTDALRGLLGSTSAGLVLRPTRPRQPAER